MSLSSMSASESFWFCFDSESFFDFVFACGYQFADKFKEAKGVARTAGSTGSGTSSAAGVTVTTNGTVTGAVNGTTESPLSTPSAGHKTSSVKSNSSASSGEVGI